jgi:hypothetical protein
LIGSDEEHASSAPFLMEQRADAGSSKTAACDSCHVGNQALSAMNRLAEVKAIAGQGYANAESEPRFAHSHSLDGD